MDDTHKRFKELLKNRRKLTDKEVDDLRKKAVKYCEQGGDYLQRVETK